MKKLAIASIFLASPLLWLMNYQVGATPTATISQSIRSQAAQTQGKWVRMSEKQEINQIKRQSSWGLGHAEFKSGLHFGLRAIIQH